MPFVKGQSGNPSGREKGYAQMARRLEDMTPRALTQLAKLAFEGESETIRLAACRDILDRSLGKAKQNVAVDVQHSLSQQHLAALKLINERARISQNELIDVTPAHDSSPQLAPTIAPTPDAHD